MPLLRRVIAGFRRLLRQAQIDQELDVELRAFLETSIEEKQRAGQSGAQATRAARMELGSITAVKEQVRDVGWESLIDSLGQDVRYAMRSLRKSPGFSAVAILTLALGIGVNAAMFAAVNAVLLKPLPFRDAERLMLVHLQAPAPERGPGAYSQNSWSHPKYRAFLDVQRTFDSTALFSERVFAISGESDPESVRGEVITDGYPGVLGIAPILGRSFTGEEAHRPGAEPVALVGYGLWMRRYNGDPSIGGRTIQVNATTYTVVGVLPAGFRGLTGNAEIWVPLATFEPFQVGPNAGYSHSYFLVARRKPAISGPSAISAVRDYGAQVDTVFSQRFPDPNTPWGASAASFYDSRADVDVRRALMVLLGAVGFVLLIACINLTNLFMARAVARRRELAVRAALGASRLRVARQFLLEALLLAATGAAIGLMSAGALLRGAVALLPTSDVFFGSPLAPGVPRIEGGWPDQDRGQHDWI